jgi:phosphoribosylglycinamide formyltransferase-1
MLYKIVVFGYNFPHIKCEMFIHILKKYNIKISAYIGTNKVKLNLPKKVYNKNISVKTVFEPRKLCKMYGIPYYISDHNSDKTIKIIKKKKANLGIIAGSRILKSNIINSVRYGIINFHPGKIPEASGLDALLWSIYKDLRPYVTMHFIDNKIDAGKRIFEKKVKFDADDRVEDIKHKINLVEYDEFEKLCENYLSKKKRIYSKKITNYKSSNKPMTEEQQKNTLAKFELWKKKLI